jgi:hypothetical protein
MTDKPTPEQIQRAKQLGGYSSSAEYGNSNWPVFTALADTIARLDAMQAERDKATADLGAIDEIAAMYGWNKPEADIGKKTVAAIAAPYRVETDPLEADADKLMAMDQSTRVIVLSALKRGLEIGRSA